MVFYEKIYLEAYIDNQYICLKNNTARIIFLLGRADLYIHLNFSSLLRDAPGIYRSPPMHMVKIHFLLERL